MYLAPRHQVLRWLAEIGPDLPEPVEQRLRAMFFTSRISLVVGAISTIAVASVAYLRTGHAAFAILAVLDLILLVVRIGLLRRVNAPSGPIFATGLLWASLQGVTIALVVGLSDVAMSIVVLASGLGAIGGIIGRNFAAPRYAMAQVLVIDLSYKIPFSIIHPEFLPLLLIQGIVFILMNMGIVKQQRTAAIRAIVGEFESRRQSITDPLTGLVNRRGLEEAFDGLLGSVGSRVLFYLDLDGFKQVNDRKGHAAGDALLREVGRRLRDAGGPDIKACRLGGDEFLLLAHRLAGDRIRQLGTGLVEAVGVPYRLEDGALVTVGVSIGIAEEHTGALELAEMMLRADLALYAAKTSGKGRWMVYGSDDVAMSEAA